ncbi:Ti-type conjugative transfer relaxase [Paramagnetospirillum caucaseum]|uniref:Ti-type conjugative transfer relaxase n=1 Tax=Paramagnetospirillum caucaseum TaxID=1244869 RepID=M3A6F2_9PROT|nr:MobA/MobL family protein [Paramagnetospirillum caucaseum]EME68049.1 Ti-type conjugative transfer relaxase [Paramagnetospirillum caucaseum]
MKQNGVNVGVVQRSAGGNAVKAAAYEAGEKLDDITTGQTFDFTRKADEVAHKEIILPADAPAWASDRASLWQAAERAETRGNSQTARTMVLDIPREIPTDLQADFARSMLRPYAEQGMAVDFAIHRITASDGGANDHIHAMLTMRRFDQSTETGFSKNKARDWNDIFADFSKGRKPTGEKMKAYRDDLADRATAWCQSNGVALEISYKSNEALGKPAAEPTLPRWHFKKLEQTGEVTPDLAEVLQFRQQKKEAVQEATAAEAEIIDLTERLKRAKPIPRPTDPKAILADLTKDAKEASIQSLWRLTDAENAQRQHATAKPKGFWCRFNGKLRQWEEERERLDRAFAEATQTRVEAIEHLEKEKTNLRPKAERTAKENEEANKRELATTKPAEAYKVNEELARQIKREKAKEFLERNPPPKKKSPDEENAYKGMRM